MKGPFFPTAGQPVVPLVTLDDDTDLTLVQSPKNGSLRSTLKLWIFRMALGSLLKVTLVNVKGDNCRVTYKRN
jgi:hypothetical protein